MSRTIMHPVLIRLSVAGAIAASVAQAQLVLALILIALKDLDDQRLRY